MASVDGDMARDNRYDFKVGENDAQAALACCMASHQTYEKHIAVILHELGVAPSFGSESGCLRIATTRGMMSGLLAFKSW